MKTLILILFIFFCTSKLTILGQTLQSDSISDKQAKEIAYINYCIKENRKVDSLIEWKFVGWSEKAITYQYKAVWTDFVLNKDADGVFLKEINQRRSHYEWKIFTSDVQVRYEVTNDTRFGVWMSEITHGVYFCLINPDHYVVWVHERGEVLRVEK